MRNGTGMSYYENYMVLNIALFHLDLLFHTFVTRVIQTSRVASAGATEQRPREYSDTDSTYFIL